MSFILGLDLGKQSDMAALAVLEQTLRSHPLRPTEQEPTYACPYLKRWQLGTSYTQIVEDVCNLVKRPPLHEPILAMDKSGVGQAVYDMFVVAQPAAWLRPISITAGAAVSEKPDGTLHVAKRELASVLVSVFAGRRLAIVGTPEGAALQREIQKFTVKMTAAGNETFEAAQDRDHDDLVMAVALALFIGEHCNSTWDGSIGMSEQSALQKAPAGLFAADGRQGAWQYDERFGTHRWLT